MRCSCAKPNGVKCSRTANPKSKYCWQHMKRCASAEIVKPINLRTCICIKPDGAMCVRRASPGSMFCWQHKKKCLSRVQPKYQSTKKGSDWVLYMKFERKDFNAMILQKIKSHPKWNDPRVQKSVIDIDEKKYIEDKPEGKSSALFITSYLGETPVRLVFHPKLREWLKQKGTRMISSTAVAKEAMGHILIQDIKKRYSIFFIRDIKTVLSKFSSR